MSDSKMPIITQVAAAVVIGLTVLISGWLLLPYNVIEGGSLVTDRYYVKAGETINYHTDYCKHYDMPGKLSIQLIDTFAYNYNTLDSNAPIGCKGFDRGIYIPKGVPPGNYFLRVTIRYQVNPLREVIYTNETNVFEVYE